jgi:hypothetical protein
MLARKDIVVFKCNACGGEGRIRRAYVDDNLLDYASCFCSKCSDANKQEAIGHWINAGAFFVVYPKVVSIGTIYGIARAREILQLGMEQIAREQNE